MEEKGNNVYKTLFYAVILVLILAGAGIGGFFFGQSPMGLKFFGKTANTSLLTEQVNLPTQTPSPTILVSEDANMVAIGTNTVSFGRKGNITILRYRGKMYDDTDQFLMEAKLVSNESSYQWYGLVNTPDGVATDEFMKDEVFGFKQFTDNKRFLFIMRWGLKTQDNSISYYVYYYNPFEPEKKLILLQKFNGQFGSPKETNIPKIDQISLDNKFVSFNMFPCWNCGGGKSDTLLMNLETLSIKSIGKVSYFVWKEKGNYEYKEYKVIPCVGESMGECSEKPENLPLKTGSFE